MKWFWRCADLTFSPHCGAKLSHELWTWIYIVPAVTAMDSPDPGHTREEALACRVPRKGNLCRWDRGHCSSMSVVAFAGLLWLHWWIHIWFGFRIRLFTNLRGHNQCWETCPKVIKQTHGRWAEQQELVYSCKASGLSTVYNYKGTSKKIDILPCKLRTCLWIYEHWKTFSRFPIEPKQCWTDRFRSFRHWKKNG